MEWLYFIPATVISVFVVLILVNEYHFKEIDKKILQHRLDADPFKDYVQAKRELRAIQHHDWNKEFGPPYWFEPDYGKECVDSVDRWFTDIQIRQLQQRKRKP